MRAFATIFLLASITFGVSCGFIVNSLDESGGHELLKDIKTVANDLKESLMHKKKAVVDTASTIAKAKLDVIRNIKEANGHVANNILRTKLAKLEAIRAAKQELLDSFMNKLRATFTKPEQSTELQPSQPVHFPKLQELHENISKHPLLHFLSQSFPKFLKPLEKEDSSQKNYIKIDGVDYVFVPAPNPTHNLQPFYQPEEAQDDRYPYVNVQPRVTEPGQPPSLVEQPPTSYGPPAAGYNPPNTYINNVA